MPTVLGRCELSLLLLAGLVTRVLWYSLMTSAHAKKGGLQTSPLEHGAIVCVDQYNVSSSIDPL